MKKLFQLVFVSLLLTPAPESMASFNCNVLLSKPASISESDATTALIAYLEKILEARVIGDAELRRFSNNLEAGKLVNPIEGNVATDHKLFVHYEGLQSHIGGKIDIPRLLEWVKQKMDERGRIDTQRKEAEAETEDLVTPLFIDYLEALLEGKTINRADLVRFTRRLQTGTLTNPVRMEHAVAVVTARLHRESLKEYLTNPKLNRTKILEWAVKRMEELE